MLVVGIDSPMVYPHWHALFALLDKANPSKIDPVPRIDGNGGKVPCNNLPWLPRAVPSEMEVANDHPHDLLE